MSTALHMTSSRTAVWRFPCTDADGVALPITGAQARFAVRPYPVGVDEVLSKDLDDGITIIDGPGGILDVKVVPDDPLALGTYRWELTLSFDEDDVYPVSSGLLFVAEAVGTVGFVP